MPQGTSSTALTTSHHPNLTFGRSRRRVTTFTPAKPASTDPARDLAAAVAAWDRIAVPVADPRECPVTWCLDCNFSGDAEDPILHQSAEFRVEAFEHNGVMIGTAARTDDHLIRVTVERCDGGTHGDEPATVYVNLGGREGPDLSPSKARELATALRKAKTSAVDLLHRPGVEDDTAGVTSIVRVQGYNIQVGAIFDDGTALVYFNFVRAYTAVETRDQARHGIRPPVLPETWDLMPFEAGQLAAALAAAAEFAAADRAARAVTA